MFDFLFKDNSKKLLEEANSTLSKDVEFLTKELASVKRDYEVLKTSLAETQMSLNVLITATQGVADDLSFLYSTVMGGEKRSSGVLAFPISQFEDDDYEN